MQTTGKVEDLSNGGSQAINALLHSIAPELKDRPNLSPEASERLSAKITELLGTDAADQFLKGNSDQQVLNEEGLPILDVAEDFIAGTSQRPPRPTDLGIPRFHSLTAEQNARRLAERDRILDQLEAEEEAERQRDLTNALARRQENIQKFEQAALSEKERLQAQKELQKKMGKALIRDFTAIRDREAAERMAEEESIQKQNPKPHKDPTKKKSVTFSERVEVKIQSPFSATDSPYSAIGTDWGDVTPARLRLNSPTPISKLQTTVKMNVVERVPTGNPLKQNGAARQFLDDSDDESVPLESSSEDEIDNEFDDDELDIDTASHQREIALEYCEKREQMGQAATSAMLSNHIPPPSSQDINSPLPRKKSSISRFRASHMVSHASESLGGSMLPESGTRIFQNSIRMGKLDANDRLVGNDEESDDDGLEAAREIFELLKKGQVENIGPDAPSSSSPFSPIKPLERKEPSTKFQPSLRSETTGLPSSKLKQAPQVVESPSFPPNGFPTVVESPSFPYIAPDQHSSRPDRPPQVIAATVRESRKHATAIPSREPEAAKKVSRFMAERAERL